MGAITAVAPWFGSKRSLAKIICDELGPHRGYYEPFCGSMAILLAKEPAAAETVNDLHKDLINLARVLASDSAPYFHQLCMATLYHEDTQRECADVVRSTGCVPAESPADVTQQHCARAWNYFVSSWMGRNGTAGCPYHTFGSSSVRWTPNGGSSAVRFMSAADSIPEWHNRIRRVCILNRDAFDVLAKVDDHPDTAIYCDPPYLRSTRGKGGGSVYLHDFIHTDHAKLATALRRFTRARVVVSYYNDSSLPSLYPGWTILDLSRAKNLSVQNRRNGTTDIAPEVLLINGPSFTQPKGSLF